MVFFKINILSLNFYKKSLFLLYFLFFFLNICKDFYTMNYRLPNITLIMINHDKFMIKKFSTLQYEVKK